MSAGERGKPVSLVSGYYHTCALFSGGSVECWGDNSDGQLGTGVGCLRSSSYPLPVSNLCGVKALSASALSTCALLDDGTVECWGNSHYADRVTPETSEAGSDRGCITLASTGQPYKVGSMPGRTPCVTSAVAVAAGGAVDCVILADASMRCWGSVDVALGNGTGLTPLNGAPTDTPPVRVSGIENAVAVSANNASVCAVLADTSVRCWGANESGQLGNGTTTRSALPVEVTGLTGAASVSTGATPSGTSKCAACDEYSCALLTDGTARCWGENQNGELGNGMTLLQATPTPHPVLNLPPASSIVAGQGHVFAILRDGRVMAWGKNSSGELGDIAQSGSSVPVSVKNLEHVESISSGVSHACALTSDGVVQCWGDNGYGQLGDGQPQLGRKGSGVPVQVQWH